MKLKHKITIALALIFLMQCRFLGASYETFESTVKGRVLKEESRYFFTGHLYDQRFYLPPDVDPSIEHILGHSISVIAGGFDMETKTMWILRFHDIEHNKIFQIFPGKPGTTAHKDVKDITDLLAEYGYLYLSKLELDVSKVYLFNFAKTIDMYVMPQGVPLHINHPVPSKKLLFAESGQKDITLEEILEKTGDLNIAQYGYKLFQFLNNVQAEVFNYMQDYLVAQGYDSVDSSKIVMLNSQDITFENRSDPNELVRLYTAKYEKEELHVQAIYSSENGEVKTIESLDESDVGLAAVRAREHLREDLKVDDLEDISLIDSQIISQDDFEDKKAAEYRQLIELEYQDQSRYVSVIYNAAQGITDTETLSGSSYLVGAIKAKQILQGELSAQSQDIVLVNHVEFAMDRPPSASTELSTQSVGSGLTQHWYTYTYNENTLRVKASVDTLEDKSVWGNFKLAMPNNEEGREYIYGAFVSLQETSPPEEEQLPGTPSLTWEAIYQGAIDEKDLAIMKEKQETLNHNIDEEKSIRDKGIGIINYNETERDSSTTYNP